MGEVRYGDDFIIIKRANDNKHKYTAMVYDEYARVIATVKFGVLGRPHYRDNTPYALYRHNDTRNKHDRDIYTRRMGAIKCKRSNMAIIHKIYSAAWFSRRFLWS